MFRRNRVVYRTTALVSVILLVMLALAASTTADTAPYRAVDESSPDAPPPPLINYQGRLLNPGTGEPVDDGPYNATFGIYTADVGGALLWGEKQVITTSKGLFSVTLGTVNPIDPGLFDGYARWLSVSIDPSGELLPRIRVAHAPYAIWSNSAAFASSANWAAVAETAVDSERLGGNLPGAFAPEKHSHDATNIVSGNLHTDRYHAIDDLDMEGYLSNAVGGIAVNNGVLQPKLNAQFLNGAQSSDFAWAGHTHDGTTIVDGSIATADLADKGVTSAKIAAGGVATVNLADASVTSAKIADGTVANADLAASSVTTAKISSSGASTNHVLQYNGSSVAWGYAPGSEIKFTVLTFRGCDSPLVSFGGTWVKILDLGTVSKLDATSRLDITFNGRIYVSTFTGSNGASFELRLDNSATTNGYARASLRTQDVGGGGVQASMTGIFTGYGAGTHTVSMWVYNWYGTGTYAQVDPGCYSTDHVVVREIK